MKKIILLIAVVLMAACNMQPEPVEERVQARLDALLEGDVKKAYKYLSPGYRSSVSLEKYQDQLSRRRVSWVAASYENHSCAEDACQVQVNLTYRVLRPLPQVDEWESTRSAEEKWVKVGRHWYFLPEK